MESITRLAQKSREAGLQLQSLNSSQKNELLQKIAQSLVSHAAAILKANAKDVKYGRGNGLSEGLIDRLQLTSAHIKTLADSVKKIAQLKDPVGEVLEHRSMKNGLELKRMRVPLGVVAMIYEARPNVTVDAAALCLKTGNAVLLKGGSDALESNKILVEIIRSVLKKYGLADAVQLITTREHNVLNELLTLNKYVDVIIPRGSQRLINFVRENATVPVIETGASVVHTYVHSRANIHLAAAIAINAKLRRLSICNALDVLLIDKACATKFIKEFTQALGAHPHGADRLEIRADNISIGILKKIPPPQNFKLTVKKATPQDFDTEFLDAIVAIKIVNGLNEALAHIQKHSLRHSEAIITEDAKTAEIFLNKVDAACVYWNASTQFSDGGEFGLGAEIGISTQKLHARGPFALEALTSYKWIGKGTKRPTVRT